jgi:hypothetical protein
MKLRLRGDSIRLRLGQSEVQQMRDQGLVEESITFDIFGKQRLIYALYADPDSPAITASFEDGRIVVRVPTALVRRWAETDLVGIESAQSGKDGHSLKILIEKDFQCVDNTNESQEDAFPNPQATSACGPLEAIARTT